MDAGHNTIVRASAAVVVALTLPVAACGLVYTVDCSGGGDFTEIQAAVDCAASGDTLVLLPCVYAECVEILEKNLTILGEGVVSTEIVSSGDCPALTVVDTGHYSSIGVTALRGVAISGSSYPSVFCEFGRLELRDCAVGGFVAIGTHYTPSFWDADLEAYDCTFGHVDISAEDYLPSVMERCLAENVTINGYHGWPGYGTRAELLSTDNTISGWLDVNGGTLVSQGDSARVLHVLEPNMEMTDVTISDLHANLFVYEYSGKVDISESVIDTMWCWGWGYECELRLVGTCVRKPSEISHSAFGAVELIHNTFLAPLDLHLDSSDPSHAIRSNVFLAGASGSVHGSVPIDYNCFGMSPSISGGSWQSNMTTDPLLCDSANGSCDLQDCSPCIGAAHDGGNMGACGIGCACMTPAEERSWGRLKWEYR